MYCRIAIFVLCVIAGIGSASPLVLQPSVLSSRHVAAGPKEGPWDIPGHGLLSDEIVGVKMCTEFDFGGICRNLTGTRSSCRRYTRLGQKITS